MIVAESRRSERTRRRRRACLALALTIAAAAGLAWALARGEDHEEETTPHPRPHRTTKVTLRDLPEPDDPPSITAVFTTRVVERKQLAAISSWLAAGCSVIVFADNVSASDSAVAARFPSLRVYEHKVRVLPIEPSATSPATGKVKLSFVLKTAEPLLETRRVAITNDDVMVDQHLFPVAMAAVPSTFVASGMRFDCLVDWRVAPRRMAFDDVEMVVVQDPPRRRCSLYGPHVGMDFFVFARDDLATRLAHVGGLDALDFYLGQGMWDNALAEISKEDLVDVSAIAMLAHLGEADAVWRDTRSNADISTNLRAACRVRGLEPGSGDLARCAVSTTVLDSHWMLCPDTAKGDGLGVSLVRRPTPHGQAARNPVLRPLMRRGESVPVDAPFPFWRELVSSRAWASLLGCSSPR